MKGIRELGNLAGLDRMIRESQNFDNLIKAVYQITAKEVYNSFNPEGLAVFAYGSPGRIELIGGDADADIFLVEEKRTNKTIRFKSNFKEKLSYFGYSKIDLPEWGDIKEVKTYLTKSLVEGNQVLETRFLMGDKKVDNLLKQIKQEYNSPERAIKNIIFNRFFFEQYFKQKSRKGAPNIKYCRGGSREFLIISWYSNLMEMIKGENSKSPKPMVLKGLKRFLAEGKISLDSFNSTLEAINFMSILRGDILYANRNTKDKGLTILDFETAGRLKNLGYSNPKETIIAFEYYRKIIEDTVNLVYQEIIEQASQMKGNAWRNNFKVAQTKISEQKRLNMSTEDPLIRMALLWGANNFSQEKSFNKIAEKHLETDEWSTIGSIVCSPLCNPEFLDFFGRNKAKETGFGYLLRIIARNPKTPRKTLESIAEDQNLEKRYKEVAEAALDGGNPKANNQI